MTQTNDRFVKKRIRVIGAATGLLMLTFATASAQTVCVRCTGPDQTYACAVTADHPIADAAVNLFCVSRIASEHNHESCGVERGQANCAGLPVSYAYDGSDVPNVAVNPAQRDNPAETPGKAEPSTLGEFTKETFNASAKAVKKAGENIEDSAATAGKKAADAIKGTGKAIGDATKKTLKCLGSALNDC